MAAPLRVDRGGERALGFAAAGWLPPVAGALVQEVIDVAAVVNALRVALPPRSLIDYDAGTAGLRENLPA